MSALHQGLHLQTGMRQHLAMTPQLIQAMELLELPLLNLEQRLQSEAAANPALELEELSDDDLSATVVNPPPTAELEQTRRTDYGNSDIDAEWVNVHDDFPPRARSGGDDDEFDPLSVVAERQIALDEHLRKQLELLTLDARIKSLCIEIILALDDRGYFTESLSSFGKKLLPPPSVAEQKTALATVQSLSPAGIAATSLADCFLLQLHQMPETPAGELAQKIIGKHLNDLTDNRMPKMIKELRVDIKAVKAAIGVLRSLDPQPGKNYLHRAVPPVRPDVYIEIVDCQPSEITAASQNILALQEKERQAQIALNCGQIEEYAVREVRAAVVDAQTELGLFNDDGTKWNVRMASGTAVEISPIFLALFDNTGRGKSLRENWERDAEKRERLHELQKVVFGDLRKKFRENFFNAGNIIRAVRQREITILRITREIIIRQKDYLTERAATPAPLMMKEVAEKLEIDTGTVSRAMSDKYADTPLGLRPLREFFTRGVIDAVATTDPTAVSGDKISNVLVRNRIAALIANEDKKEPLKDHIIQQLLSDEGIVIKRRTVAKHRGLLGIGDYKHRREY